MNKNITEGEEMFCDFMELSGTNLIAQTQAFSFLQTGEQEKKR